MTKRAYITTKYRQSLETKCKGENTPTAVKNSLSVKKKMMNCDECHIWAKKIKKVVLKILPSFVISLEKKKWIDSELERFSALHCITGIIAFVQEK